MLKLHNAKIYTLDSAHPLVSTLVIDQGRIVAVGDHEWVHAASDTIPSRKIQALDMDGQIIIPGLTDAHIHLQHYALSLQKIDCETAARQECLTRVARAVQRTPAGKWVLGHGWNQNLWPEGFGNARDLDEISPAHPVYLTAKSLHAAWANTAALKAAGIAANTSDPADGEIQRDQHGNPTGILFESAMSLVSEIISTPARTEIAAALQAAQQKLWAMGLTGVHDFDRRDCFAALQELHRDGELKLRVVKSIPLELLPQAADLGLGTGFGDEWLRLGGVKAFADGALGPHTAAMLDPYENDPENRGMLFFDGEELFELGRLAVENRLPLAVHAIGDRAMHEVLNGLEQLRTYEGQLPQPVQSQPLRHRIEHVQLIHPDDASRLAQLNVIASMQPLHATSDMDMAEAYWGARSRYAYAWKTQLQHGATLAFGSDAPVESPNPFWGLHAAVTRQRANGAPGPEGWIPAERLSLQNALAAYTTGPAFAAGMENSLGKLAPGCFADLLVLDQDLFNCTHSELRDIAPVKVMVGGQWVIGAA